MLKSGKQCVSNRYNVKVCENVKIVVRVVFLQIFQFVSFPTKTFHIKRVILKSNAEASARY
jgi:hypothetical protein